jgi:hypothetical protein
MEVDTMEPATDKQIKAAKKKATANPEKRWKGEFVLQLIARIEEQGSRIATLEKALDINEEGGLDSLIGKLAKDVRVAAKKLRGREAKFLVDYYYQRQEDRKRTEGQLRAALDAEEPGEVITWLTKKSRQLENAVKGILDAWSAGQEHAIWARSIKGIGPVISAGLLAHIDMKKAVTAGNIWSFCGYDPRVLWLGRDGTHDELETVIGKKPKISYDDIVLACDHFRRRPETIERYCREVRKKDDDGKVQVTISRKAITFDKLAKALARKPWNGDLKTLCWKIGESFVKVKNTESFYGKLYAQYRHDEDVRNDRGDYAVAAAAKLKRFRIGKSTDAYAAYSIGKLPKGHLNARAKRRVVKLFLSHYHEVGYELLYDKPAPRPWAIENGGHTHYIAPPNWNGPQ